MLSDEYIQETVSNWYGTGQITDNDLATLKERYLSDLGATTCTSCPNWKTDMLDHFRRYLRVLNKPAMSTTKNQYRIKESVGSFYSPAHGTLFTNSPSTSPGVTQVSDGVYDALIALDEGYAEHFEKNPDYKPKEVAPVDPPVDLKEPVEPPTEVPPVDESGKKKEESEEVK